MSLTRRSLQEGLSRWYANKLSITEGEQILYTKVNEMYHLYDDLEEENTELKMQLSELTKKHQDSSTNSNESVLSLQAYENEKMRADILKEENEKLKEQMSKVSEEFQLLENKCQIYQVEIGNKGAAVESEKQRENDLQNKIKNLEQQLLVEKAELYDKIERLQQQLFVSSQPYIPNSVHEKKIIELERTLDSERKIFAEERSKSVEKISQFENILEEERKTLEKERIQFLAKLKFAMLLAEKASESTKTSADTINFDSETHCSSDTDSYFSVADAESRKSDDDFIDASTPKATTSSQKQTQTEFRSQQNASYSSYIDSEFSVSSNDSLPKTKQAWISKKNLADKFAKITSFWTEKKTTTETSIFNSPCGSINHVHSNECFPSSEFRIKNVINDEFSSNAIPTRTSSETKPRASEFRMKNVINDGFTSNAVPQRRMHRQHHSGKVNHADKQYQSFKHLNTNFLNNNNKNKSFSKAKYNGNFVLKTDVKYPFVVYSVKHLIRLSKEKICKTSRTNHKFVVQNGIPQWYTGPMHRKVHKPNIAGPNFKWVPKCA